MNCPACSNHLEELLWPDSLKPCGILACKLCRSPDNRWVLQSTNLVRYVVPPPAKDTEDSKDTWI